MFSLGVCFPTCIIRELGRDATLAADFHFLFPVFMFCDEELKCDLVPQLLVHDRLGKVKTVHVCT